MVKTGIPLYSIYAKNPTREARLTDTVMYRPHLRIMRTCYALSKCDAAWTVPALPHALLCKVGVAWLGGTHT